MSALVRAELLKLRTVALPAWLLLTTLALVVLSVCVTILTAGLEGAPLPARRPRPARPCGASASAGNIVLLVLGILVADAGVPVRHGDAVVPGQPAPLAGARRQAAWPSPWPGSCSPCCRACSPWRSPLC